MSDTGIKVLGAGSALMDCLIFADDAFLLPYAKGQKGGTIRIDSATFRDLTENAKKSGFKILQIPGGSAYNTLCGLLHLGIYCSLFGKTGKDEAGRSYRDAFHSLGGDTSSFKVSSSLPTGCCVCAVTPDSQRTMFTLSGASAELDKSDVLLSDFQNVTHLYLEGYMLYTPDVVMELIRQAKAHHCTISADLSSPYVVRQYRREWSEILPDLDLLFANEMEAEAFTGEKDPEKALNVLAQECPCSIVKLGEKGAILSDRGAFTRLLCYPVKAVDTTGAGDLWQAGFLYGWLNGEKHEVSGEYAARIAAEIVQVSGGCLPEERWTKILKQEAISKVLKKQKRK